MTSLMMSHFEKYAFSHHILVFPDYVQQHITAVGSKLLWHPKWYIIRVWHNNHTWWCHYYIM